MYNNEDPNGSTFVCLHYNIFLRSQVTNKLNIVA